VPGTKVYLLVLRGDFMRIISAKRAIIVLLMIGIIAGVSGCARWPYGPEPEPGTEYQLEITVEVAREINTDEGIYYIIFDADSDSADGPGDDINFWDEDYFYIMLDQWGFSFAQVKDDLESIFYGGSITGDNRFKITIAISDLGDPAKIDINVLTTDSDNHTYDSLSDGYFFMNTSWGSSKTIDDSEGDSGEGGEDFDIKKVTAVITTL
jgi:hypothetical protein